MRRQFERDLARPNYLQQVGGGESSELEVARSVMAAAHGCVAAAARMLGYATPWGLTRRLRKLGVDPGEFRRKNADFFAA